MADYWISQTRKYCDFCKCWITDNKPSVDFHEKGRRHQENVKKKLRNISKANTQTQKNTERFDITLRQMESAALESYRKDIETNGDLTSMMIQQKISQTAGPITKLWNEAKSRDGKSHYVNVMTNETVYQPPPEGYLTLKEQREQAELQTKKELDALAKYKRKEAIVTLHKRQQEDAEESARQAREKLKERRVVMDDIAPTTCGPLLEPGKTNPYGRWQTVKEAPMPDLQLPPLQYAYVECPVQFEPEPIKEFKEKIIETGESVGSGESTFKKRKFASGAKRNTRQRLSDD